MAPTDPLSRLVACLESSLPMYLGDSGIGSYPGGSEIKRAINAVVDEQRDVVARAATLLAEREQAVPRTAYPISFTALHDVDLAHLLPRLVAGLDGQARECEAITVAATHDASAAALAAEAGRAARRHAGLLGDLASRVRAGLAGQSA